MIVLTRPLAATKRRASPPAKRFCDSPHVAEFARWACYNTSGTMNTRIIRMACTLCVAVGIAATGCSGLPGYTSFAVTFVYGQTSVTSIGLGAEKCILWSKAAAEPTCTPEDYYRCSGSHPLPDGQRVAWQCETKDGRTFTQITINSKSYDLAKGRLFLLSAEGGTIKLLQLDRDPAKLKITELDGLAEKDPEVRAFFGTSNGKPGNGDNAT